MGFNFNRGFCMVCNTTTSSNLGLYCREHKSWRYHESRKRLNDYEKELDPQVLLDLVGYKDIKPSARPSNVPEVPKVIRFSKVKEKKWKNKLFSNKIGPQWGRVGYWNRHTGLYKIYEYETGVPKEVWKLYKDDWRLTHIITTPHGQKYILSKDDKRKVVTYG